MSENTRICPDCCSTPQIAVNNYDITARLQEQTNYIYASTINGSKPKKRYQFKTETERIQALLGKLSFGNC